MKKYLLLLIVLFSILFLNNCKENEMNDDEEELEEEDDFYYDDHEEFGYFKAGLKEYLVANNLFNSERVIAPDEMKKIFLDVITEGDTDSGPSHLRTVFDRLAEHFVEVYYNDKKQIRGKDIYKLMDINEISMKFEEIAGKTPLYDYYNEEEDDLDNIDTKNDL